MVDGPAANDLQIAANITDGITSFQTQTVTIGGSPTNGTYQLSGGPLTAATSALSFSTATAAEIQSAIARVLPTGVTVVVTQSGTSPNFINTINFTNLTFSAAVMTVTNNSLLNTNNGAAGTVGVVNTTPFTAVTGSMTMQAAAGSQAPRVVLSGSNTYGGSVTINSGILQAASNTALGTSAGGTTVGGAATSPTGAVLELNSVTVTGEALTMSSNIAQDGVYDQASTVQIAPSNNTANSFVRMGSGGLRAVAGTSNSWTGNISLSSGSNVNSFGIAVGAGGSLDVSGVISGTAANATFKQGTGTLTYSGTASNTAGGTTFVQDGTLVLNKLGTAQAIAGNLVVGDTVGGDNSDLVTYGTKAGSDQIKDAQSLTVLSSGKYDLSGANTYLSSLRLLTFPTGTADATSFTVSFLGLSATFAYSVTPATTVNNIKSALTPPTGRATSWSARQRRFLTRLAS